MAFSAAEVDVTNEATPITIPETGTRLGVSVIVTNTGNTDLRLGGADVNMTDKGWPFPAGATLPMAFNKTDTFYVISATTGKIAWLKQDD